MNLQIIFRTEHIVPTGFLGRWFPGALLDVRIQRREQGSYWLLITERHYKRAIHVTIDSNAPHTSSARIDKEVTRG